MILVSGFMMFVRQRQGRCNVDMMSWLLSGWIRDLELERCKMEMDFVCDALWVNFDS